MIAHQHYKFIVNIDVRLSNNRIKFLYIPYLKSNKINDETEDYHVNFLV